MRSKHNKDPLHLMPYICNATKEEERKVTVEIEGLVLWEMNFNNSWVGIDLTNCEFKYCTFNVGEFRFSKLKDVKFLYCRFPGNFKFSGTMCEGVEITGCTDTGAAFMSHVSTRREWERDSGIIHTTQYVNTPTSNELPWNFYDVGEVD